MNKNFFSSIVSFLKTGGGVLLGLAVFVGLLVLFALFVNVGVPFYANHISGVVDIIESWVFLISLIFLFLCIFRKFRIWAGQLLALSALLLLIGLWLGSLVNTFEVFGGVGVFIGVVILGVGIFFTGLAALLWAHSWLTFFWFLGSGIYMYGISVLGNHLSDREEERRFALEYPRDPAPEEEFEITDSEMKETVSIKEFIKPFVAFIKNDPDFTYEAFLVNPTDTTYLRVNSLTWGTASDSDGLLETSKGVREKGQLNPHSAILLEQDTRDGLDFVILYHLDMYEKNALQPMQVKFNLPKGHWEYKTTQIPILNREGMIIDLAPRNTHETIEQEITHMNMESSYRSNDELSAP
jgi:hypothetical protein